MYLIVSWDIKAPNQEMWDAANKHLRAALKNCSWVRVLTTFYVIRIGGMSDRASILSGLQSAVANLAPTTRVLFLVSPALPPGSFDGILPAEDWPHVNERTL
jgi:hypothetical protein